MANLSNINNKLLVGTNGEVRIGDTATVADVKLRVKQTAQQWTAQFVNTDSSVAYGISIDTSASSYGVAGTLQCYTNSGGGFIVRNDSRVGIGTAGPSVKLDVVGSGKFQPGIADGDALVTIAQTNSNAYVHAGIKINAGNTNPFYIYQSGSSNTLRFNYNSLADAGGQLVITDSGNVGIGTTLPQRRLTVGDGSGSEIMSIYAGNTSSSAIHFTDTNTTTDYQGFVTYNHNLDALRFGTAEEERMLIDSSGLINFSKTATTATAVASINHASNDFLYINGGTAGASFGDDNQSTRVICYNNDYIRFDSAAVERMRLTPDGNNTFLIIKAKPATYNSKSFITLYGTNSSAYGGSIIARSSISSETDGSAYGANLKFYTNDSSNVEQTRLQISSNGFGYFYNNFYLASAANQGNLFFGTADNQYNIFGGGTYGYMGYNTSGYHRFLASGTERMRITSAGDILCTSDGGSDAFRVFNPGTGAGDIYLRVEKAYTSAAVGRAAGIILGSNAGNLGSTWTMEATSQLGYFSGADLAFTHNSGGTASRRVTFKDGGNVGIGTDSPNARLHVDHPANPTSIRIGSNTTDDCWVMFNTDGNDWSIGTDRSDSNKFKISDYSSLGTNDRLVIDTSGNVGINITSPQDKLHVNGDAIISSTRFGDFAAAGLNTTGVVVASVAASTNGQSAIVEFVASGNNGGYYNVVYSCYNGGGAWFYSKNVVGSGGNIEVAETNGGGSSELTFKFRATSGTASYTPRVMMKGMPYNLVTF